MSGRIERLVQAAYLDGRITRDRQEFWRKTLAASPEAEKTLEALAPGLPPKADDWVV